MSKFKKLLPNLFGESKSDKKSENVDGILVADAIPVDQGENNNIPQSMANSPTASAELTKSVVRELSDSNYNSMNMAVLTNNNGNTNCLLTPLGPISGGGAQTLNTTNVHNAHQQVVMQFSNVNKLHLGSVYNFNSNVISGTSSPKSSTTEDTGSIDTRECNPNDNQGRRPRKTKSIVIMMQNQDEPTHRMMDTVATHLGEGWKQVMRDLGHSEGQIEQAIIDHQMHGGIKEVIYQLLLAWLRNADDGVATLGALTTLLWDTNHRDCVHRMKWVYKSQLNKKLNQS